MKLPVSVFVRRSLLLSSRKLTTYLLRLAVLVFLCFTLLSVHTMSAFLGAPGLMLFSAVAYFNASIILLSGPFFFASVITEEKEDLSLGFLKMAGLSPFSILAGKGTAQLLVAVMLLACQLPFVVLSVTLGGISLNQVFAAYLSLFAHLVLVANVALLFSVMCRRGGEATFLTGLALLAFFIGVPFIRSVLSRGMIAVAPVGGGGTLMSGLVSASVFVRLGEILTTGFSGSLVGMQVLSNVGAGAVFFGVSVLTFNYFTREEQPMEPMRLMATSKTSAFRWLRPGPMWRNALAWKDFYFMAGGKLLLLTRFIALGLATALITSIACLGGSSDLRSVFATTVLVLASICASVETVYQASRVFAMERRWGTLSSLMVLPMSTRRIAYSKAAGCALGLVPACAWFVVGLLLLPEPVIVSDFERVLYGVASGVMEVLIVAHLVAWLSVVLRRGGLLLALGIYFIVNMFCGGFMFMPLMLGGMYGLAFGAWILLGKLGIVALLHFVTLKRLRVVAAEQQ